VIVAVPPVAPLDYLAIKRLFRGVVIRNNGYNKARANAAIAMDRVVLVAFGKPFIFTPDLVTRLLLDAPLCARNRDTLYGSGEAGYTGYPMLHGIGALPREGPLGTANSETEPASTQPERRKHGPISPTHPAFPRLR
jgi:hypothetical protein